MTATTSPIVSSSVNCTSSTEARTVSVRSVRIVTSTPFGMTSLSFGSSVFTASATLITLAPGCRWTLRMIARFFPAHPASWEFSTPSTTLATSRRRTAEPFL